MLLKRIISGCHLLTGMTRTSFGLGEIMPCESSYMQKRYALAFKGKALKYKDSIWPPRRWWLLQKKHKYMEEDITRQNKQFLEEYKQEDYAKRRESPLKHVESSQTQTWNSLQRRTGLIGRKIGAYPLWTKNGRKVLMTLLQVTDNHVIKYTPPEDFLERNRRFRDKFGGNCGSLLIGAEDADPELYTGAYNSLFESAGVPTKRRLARFLVTPDAALKPGTPLNVMHFRPGDYVDIWGKTINHGYQGVMKRFGFKGGPATHGCTKNHRRGGATGGGKKHGLWKGSKRPGFMGNRWRYIRALQIWRINTKENVIYVAGLIPGHINDFVRIRDTCVYPKRVKEPPFPTYFDTDEPVPENLYFSYLHPMDSPSIMRATDKTPEQDQEKIQQHIDNIKKMFHL